jgi:hypothetical protein
MKKLLALLLVLTTMNSCITDKHILDVSERFQWYHRNDTIFHNLIPVAVLTHMEIELYKGDQSNELCFNQISDTLGDDHIQGLIDFVHTRYPNYKVQITTPHHR